MLVEMELREVQVIEDSNQHPIVLAERNGKRRFQIFIGTFEATALEVAIKNAQVPRPLTHDLIGNVLRGVGVRLTRVLVDQLVDDTFHGKLVLEYPDGRSVQIDSRPSDAIVLAIKHTARIFVDESVIEKASRERDEPESGPDNTELFGQGDDDDNPFG